MKTITPPLKWHGGKHYLAPKLVAMMPPHTHYVEPFAGGLSVLLAKDPEGVSEVVNDLNSMLMDFWRVLIHEQLFPLFVRRCQATPFAQEQWDTVAALGADKFGGPVARAWAFFVLARQSLAGRMESFAPLSRTRTRRGMNEQASAWLAAVEGLPAVHARLKRVVILNRDALDVIRQQDGPDTLFYLDPPYEPGTRASADVYAHEMSDEQHRDLLTLVRRCKGRVMLSGYRSAMYDDLLSAWHRTDFDLPNNSAGGAAKRRMTESVWTNFTPAGDA